MTSRPSVDPAAVCTTQSPGSSFNSSTSITQAVTGLTTNCAAAASLTASGTGSSSAAAAVAESAHVPPTLRGTTRVPRGGPLTPWPHASTRPTASKPGVAGRRGRRPYSPLTVSRSDGLIGRWVSRSRT